MAFSEQVVQAVWLKGHFDPNNDPAVWRKDDCGAWICRGEYGNRENIYGWEVDHIKPVVRGGGEELSNLRPLQWKNNAHKQDGKLGCAVTANGVSNVEVPTK